MAINVGGSGMNRGRRSRGARALAEINVTPFVDVALVLLIIFMITAHVMEYGIEIDVPKTKTIRPAQKICPIVQISKAGEVYLGKDPIEHQPHRRRGAQQVSGADVRLRASRSRKRRSIPSRMY